MKKIPVYLLALFSTGCFLFQRPPPNEYVLHVSWQPEPITIPSCQPIVQYSGRSFKTSGIEVPIPQLGGAVKVGELSYNPQTLNTLYRNVAILDALRLTYCGDRATAAQISREALQACNERIQRQEEKIAALALAATEGEAAVENAIHQVNASTTASTSANPEVKKADEQAVAGVKQNATATVSASPVADASPAAGGPAPTLPPQVASVVKDVPQSTLLKIARSKPPQPKPSATP